MVANKFKLNLFTVLLNPNYSFLTLPAGKFAGSDVSICAKMENTMITGGNATVYVSDMDRAVSFYVNVLGLRLGQRFGNHWAEIKAGENLVIGLHPKSVKAPPPGTSGAISIGLTIDEPIDQVVQRLGAKGVSFRGPVVRDPEAGIALAFFGDQDGNDLYLCKVTASW